MPRRKKAILDPNALFITDGRWEFITIALLITLLAFAPASLGAVAAWSELVVVVLAAALAICVAARTLLDGDFRPASTWLYLPLAMFILLTVVQLWPLSTTLLTTIAPSTVATKQEYLGEAIQSLDRSTLSFSPHETAAHLRLVLVGTAVFVAVASMIRDARQIKVLMFAIFTIGCAEALLAVAQIVTASDRIYWHLPTGRNLASSGTFINYSHFAQFMNLSLGAGIALLLIQFREQRRHEVQGTSWRFSLMHFGWEKYGWLLCGMVLCAISVLTSMSRNGAIAMLCAAAAVGVVVARRESLSWKGWLIGAIPMAVFALLLIVGFDVVYERLATLQDKNAYLSRWEMTAATLRAWSHYPLWGTGLGTHEYVFPMFDKSVTPQVAVHADNDYAQLLEETGVIGAALVAAFLIGIAILVGKLALRGKSSAAAGVFGVAFGLIAVAIQSASDFGQRVPANLCLSATMCGLVVSIARYEKQKRTYRNTPVPPPPKKSPLMRMTAVAGLAGTLAVCSWVMYDVYRAYIAEQWWYIALGTEARINYAPKQATDDDYTMLISAATGAFETEPDNVEYGYWLNSYRWASISRTTDDETGQLVLHPDVIQFVGRIADELAAVRRICPTYGPPYALEGQLRLFILNDANGKELIRKGVRLAAYDPPTCLVAGELAAHEGKIAEAEPLLTRAVALQPDYYVEVIKLYLQEVNQPVLARRLAGDDYWRLEHLANVAAQTPAMAAKVGEFRAAATASLRLRAKSPEATADELTALARIEHAAGKIDAAIDLYRQALAQDYRHTEWRLELARALDASGQVVEALHEVTICLRLRAQYPPAVQLKEELVKKLEGIKK